MSFVTWMNENIKKLNWIDIGLTKISVAGFILMIAKLWEPLLSLDWYWYAIIFVLAGIRPIYKAYLK